MSEKTIIEFLILVIFFLSYIIYFLYKDYRKLKKHSDWLAETLVTHWNKFLKNI